MIVYRTPESIEMSSEEKTEAVAAEGPNLKRLTNFEILMRNRNIYHPDVIQPPVVISGWAELEKPMDPAVAKAELEIVCEKFARFGSITHDDGRLDYVGPKALDWSYHLQCGPDLNSEEELMNGSMKFL